MSSYRLGRDDEESFVHSSRQTDSYEIHTVSYCNDDLEDVLEYSVGSVRIYV